ncbi:uncharacterized protein LOC117925307 isoform X1 [Vitis riparia]|uniref:uncharacterized protein LOC117925307 isoform X1 n=2 Tax=Vitis riparia TaxID=96939 RepID=UPI00155B0CA7|nr:uncharacterized protein LOC117925307 isoform X1 [Vitis riparia]
MSAADGQMLNFQPNVLSLSSPPPHAFPSFSSSSSSSSSPFPTETEPFAMSLTPLMFRSLVRLVSSLVGQPAASISTLLYYSDLLPQNIVLERLVQHELLDQENYLFHFLINFLRCFW